MLSMLKDTHPTQEVAEQALIDHLERLLDDACSGGNEEKLTKSIMLMSALFILMTGKCCMFCLFLQHLFIDVNHRLLHNLVWAPLRSFTESTVRLCVSSWNWILVAREDIQIDVAAVL